MPSHEPDRLMQALLFESGQACEHFRHTETLANQFLAFLGGLAAAYLGIMGLIFVRSGHGSIVSSLIISAVTGPFIGTIGIAILIRVEMLRFVRDFHYTRVIEPVRAYIFQHLAHDPNHSWNDELNIVHPIAHLRDQIKQERWLPWLSLRLGSDRAFAFIPLACIGTPAYALVASVWISLSPTQYFIVGIFLLYSVLLLAVILDMDRLGRKGLFGDKHLIFNASGGGAPTSG